MYTKERTKMSLISKQSRNQSKYSTCHPQHLVSNDEFDYVAKIGRSNYQSHEKSYYRQPKFFNCPFANQEECETDENYGNDITAEKNSQTIISAPEELQSEYSPRSSVTDSDRIRISNMSSASSNDTLPETCLKFNATMNATVPNSSSNKYDERSRCRVEKNRTDSLPMTFQRELTPTALRIGTQTLYKNFHQDEETKSKECGNNSRDEKLQCDKSIDCNLDLKTSMTNLVNCKSEAFVNGQHEAMIHSNTGEMSSSLSKLDELPVMIAKRKQNRFPFTICDNHRKRVEIFQHNCVNDINVNADGVGNIGTNTLVESVNDEFEKLNLPEKNKSFGSWMKSIAKIFPSHFKKKNIVKQTLNFEVLFENTGCPSSSSEIDIDKQMNCCNCDGEKMEFCFKERFRKLNCDDLWIQDIASINDKNDTDSRYSVFLVKKARDKMTATNNDEIHSPSGNQCAKCQCHLVTSSLATDTKSQQSIKNSTNVGKEIKTDCHIKLSRRCFCFRIWHLFSHQSNDSMTKKTEI